VGGRNGNSRLLAALIRRSSGRRQHHRARKPNTRAISMRHPPCAIALPSNGEAFSCPTHALRQLGDIRCNPPGLIFGEQLRQRGWSDDGTQNPPLPPPPLFMCCRSQRGSPCARLRAGSKLHLASDARQGCLAGCSAPILALANHCFDSTKRGGSGTLWYLYSKTTSERAVDPFRSHGSDQSSNVADAIYAQPDGRRPGNSPPHAIAQYPNVLQIITPLFMATSKGRLIRCTVLGLTPNHSVPTDLVARDGREFCQVE